MRLALIAAVAVLALAGCSRLVEKSVEASVGEHAAEPGKEWSMQVLGDDAARVILVKGPDGRTAAARVTKGVSTLIDDTEALGLIGESQAALAAADADGAPTERVAISAPGFSLKVAGDDEAGGTDGKGRVAIMASGVSINVDGDDAGGEGRGLVRIAGVNDRAAAEFIDGVDELSPEVKAQMREKLGL
ncbi:MAG: hypothetical protein NW200_05575 [Hyphomonadaceae bacterium]|nr:hypothetical protein [Hyphomonadaceae bacterium]